MKAALFKGPGKPLTIEEIPVPELAAGEALVRTAACGVCATDLHYLHGTPTFKQPPLILGHEVTGIIEKVSDKAAGLEEGDRVLIPAVFSCGSCSNCRQGRDNICEKMTMIGNHVDGGFAEFLKVPAKMLFKLPDDLPLQESAIISDAISTPFHAVKNRGEVRAGDSVAVFGCGGVGANAVQVAAALGATVIGVDVDERKLQLAKEMGASAVVNASEPDAGKRVKAISGGGVDAAFEVVGKPEVLEQAFISVKPGGRLVTVGYAEENWNFRVSRLMFREMSMVGSLGCRLAEYPRIIEMVRNGKIRMLPVISDRIPLEKVNDALHNLESGSVLGRQIVVFDGMGAK